MAVKKRSRTSRHKNRDQHGANLAEFGPAVFILFIVVFIPAINLVAFGWGTATAIFITSQSAKAAAVSENYDTALSSATTTAANLTNSYIGKLAHLKPVEGYNDSGIDLYIVATNILTNKTSLAGPNLPLRGVVDTTNNVYEYQIQTKYEIAPLLNLARTPMLNNIPIISKPTILSFTSQQSAEYPNGLIGNGTNASALSAPKLKIWNAPDLNPVTGSAQNSH
jgi:hypothetical protein